MKCTAINDSELSVTWSRPVNGSVVSYDITVKKYIQKEDSRQITKVNLNPPYQRSINSNQRHYSQIAKGLGKWEQKQVLLLLLLVLFFCVVKFVPYFVSVKTLNSARCGSTVVLTCFTREGGKTVQTKLTQGNS